MHFGFSRIALPAERRLELVVYSSVIAIAVLGRTIYTLPFEIGGDAVHKWQFVKDLLAGIPVSELLNNHHAARWAINLPTLALAWLFGTGWAVYYLVPLIFYSILLAASAYFIDKTALFRISAFAIFILIFYADPLYFRATTQLQPFVFVAVFVLVHVIVVCRLVDRFSVFRCFLAALFIFFAYGAKSTALFYAPATAIFVLWSMGWRPGLRTIAWIAAFGIAFLLIETAAFSLIHGKLTTRLDLMQVHFGGIDSNYALSSVAKLFAGWVDLGIYSKILYALTAVFSVLIIFRSIKDRNVTPVLMLALMFISFSLFETLLVKSLNPLLPVTPPKSKYLADLVPWATLIVVLTLDRMAQEFRQTRDRMRFSTSLVGLALGISLVSLAALSPSPAAWMWRADETYAFVAGMMRSGVPLDGGRKGIIFSQAISVEVKKIEVGGSAFWVDARLDEPPETLLSGQCISLRHLQRGALMVRDCLPQ